MKKYIFDFDDVLFNNTAQFKEHMFKLIAEAGVPEGEARAYYAKPEIRGKEFSLRKFIKDLFSFYDLHDSETSIDELYLRIMEESRKFLNTELVEMVKRIGVENCYIVTNGETEFQQDKMKYSGIWDLFGEDKIKIVPRSKREAVIKICTEHSTENVVFVDDKIDFFRDLGEISNLKTILYGENGLEKLRAEIGTNISSELKRRK